MRSPILVQQTARVGYCNGVADEDFGQRSASVPAKNQSDRNLQYADRLLNGVSAQLEEAPISPQSECTIKRRLDIPRSSRVSRDGRLAGRATGWQGLHYE